MGSDDLQLPKPTTEYVLAGAGTAAERPVRSTVPALLAERALSVDGVTAVACEEAAVLAARAREHLSCHPWLQVAVEYAEAIGSSRIEGLTAPVGAVLAAGAGVRSEAVASTIAAAASAARTLLASDGTLNDLYNAHRELMAHTPWHSKRAGAPRKELVWIGARLPEHAKHVAPAAKRVQPLLEDLMEFSRRQDVVAVVHAAVAHGQFETIHPFTDGNGRSGRALTLSVLKGDGLLGDTPVPYSSHLANDRYAYYEALGALREGNAAPLVVMFADAVTTASARVLKASAQVRAQAVPMTMGRAGSAKAKLVAAFAETPVASTKALISSTGVSSTAASSALWQLSEEGSIHHLTPGANQHAWATTEVMDALAVLMDPGR